MRLNMRFERTTLYAHENGSRVMASCLGISRWKNMAQISESGHRLHQTISGGFEDLARTLPVKFSLAVAKWTYDHVQRAGRGTDTLSAGEALYLPLKAPIGCRGVLAIQPRNWKCLEEPDDWNTQRIGELVRNQTEVPSVTGPIKNHFTRAILQLPCPHNDLPDLPLMGLLQTLAFTWFILGGADVNSLSVAQAEKHTDSARTDAADSFTRDLPPTGALVVRAFQLCRTSR
jgi:hypothetical protein